MQIKVLMFGPLAHELGVAEVALDLPDNATVAAAVDRLGTQYPILQAMVGRLATAVNLEYVAADYQLSEGDELALIPPVSGG
jgi:molybdopterin converting factor subunit 1